jgi:hypothetical protein
MIDVERVIELSASEMLKHRDKKIVLNAGLPDACILISQLQLAIQHPENPAAETARTYCEAIIGRVELFSKDLADFLRLGFDPKYDERRPR